MTIDKATALQSLAPGAKWILIDDELEWLSTDIPQPTDAEIEAEVARLQEEQPKKEVRERRDRFLTETDWVVVKHNELGTSIPQEWLDYRQALRDITEQSGFPDNVEWPTAPSNHKETN